MAPFKYLGADHQSHSLGPERIIIDVDAGIDDSLALLLFLFAEVVGLVKIEAITCVHGNTGLDNVATNIMRMLEVAERTDIPVYRGSNSSFIPPEIKGDGFFGMDGFGDLQWDINLDLRLIQRETAAVKMGKLVTKNPGKISIIGLAPCTNIALAMKLYPNFAEDVKGVYIMGGAQARGNIKPTVEFNFYLDPEAAFIVLKDSKKLVHLLTWETVLEANLSVDWRFDVLGAIDNPVLNMITTAEHTVYPGKSPIYTPADVFIAAAFLYPEQIITFQQNYPATIELHGSLTRGQVVIDHKNTTTPNVAFIESIDKEALQDLLVYAANYTKDGFVTDDTFGKG